MVCGFIYLVYNKCTAVLIAPVPDHHRYLCCNRYWRIFFGKHTVRSNPKQPEDKHGSQNQGTLRPATRYIAPKFEVLCTFNRHLREPKTPTNNTRDTTSCSRQHSSQVVVEKHAPLPPPQSYDITCATRHGVPRRSGAVVLTLAGRAEELPVPTGSNITTTRSSLLAPSSVSR